MSPCQTSWPLKILILTHMWMFCVDISSFLISRKSTRISLCFKLPFHHLALKRRRAILGHFYHSLFHPQTILLFHSRCWKAFTQRSSFPSHLHISTASPLSVPIFSKANRCISSHLSALINANGRWGLRIILFATGLGHSFHSDLVLDFILTVALE